MKSDNLMFKAIFGGNVFANHHIHVRHALAESPKPDVSGLGPQMGRNSA
jgi:hypothetical protein